MKRRLKPWNIWFNFKWNQPYLNRGLNLNRRSNSLNSATEVTSCMFSKFGWDCSIPVLQTSTWLVNLLMYLHTVKPLITNTSKEFIKCRILHFLIMECCRYLVFQLNDYMELFKTVPAYSWLFIYFRKYWNLRNIV